MGSSKDIYFYNISILNTKLPKLTYHSFEEIEIGRVVEVKLRDRLKEAVIISQAPKPEFETKPIEKVEELFFSDFILESAKFISTYYFCSYSEALSLFLPLSLDREKPPKSPKLSTLPKLSPSQQKAYNQLEKYKSALLFGVTGSGKSEIYITKIAQVIESGGSAILLMPEISLTPQMESRLRRYFGDLVAIWHSKLTKKQKEQTLQKIRDKKIRVVAGARSALFIPLDNLRVIIVDEEHDDSYKSKNRPRYNARDLAIYFGKKLDITVWLGSATPTLSSYVKYPVVRLKEPFIKSSKRYEFIAGDSINEQILKYIKINFKQNSQSLLFVPTRANFKYLYCPSCGDTHKCPFCSVGMSLNRKKRYLRCHYCNFTSPIKSECSSCGYSPLTSYRVGTQEVIEIIKEAIPEIRVEQFDKDSITTFNKLKKALDRVLKREVDIIVGTQMLSKGHDYPEITLSVIMGLDYLLGVPDYRAKERSIALLHQIAGRSGRAKDATILIQTSQPEIFSQYLEDYEIFLQEEMEFAKDFYPPFMRLARVLVANKSAKIAEDRVESLLKELERFEDVEIVGSGKAPIEKIANRYRYFILLRAKKATTLLKALYSVDISGVEIDIDPVDFS